MGFFSSRRIASDIPQPSCSCDIENFSLATPVTPNPTDHLRPLTIYTQRSSAEAVIRYRLLCSANTVLRLVGQHILSAPHLVYLRTLALMMHSNAWSATVPFITLRTLIYGENAINYSHTQFHTVSHTSSSTFAGRHTWIKFCFAPNSYGTFSASPRDPFGVLFEFFLAAEVSQHGPPRTDVPFCGQTAVGYPNHRQHSTEVPHVTDAWGATPCCRK